MTKTSSIFWHHLTARSITFRKTLHPVSLEFQHAATTHTHSARRKRIVVAVTGATGAPLAVELLHRLRRMSIETHLILSTWGASTLKYELDAPNNTAKYLESLADFVHSPRDVSASLSSGSFLTHGMIVVPCSMKTLAGIRIGYDSDLITRAAGVALKERRKLVLVARETPLSTIHLENMLEVTRAGAVVFPPVMAFYTRPKGIEGMVKQSVTRMVDCLNLASEEHDEEDGRWAGFDWEGKKRSDSM
ncbi:flavoprotein [Paraphoma chrysanthemicola]|uniref:Flavin prenyltransferase PAD1, mitochondrial n=1 Tax=Paraphoma chrysanthemicola TaxID=798071 RepID=A0A8K0RMJ2_9PLEO|nr:flavoprotein [Paraphoma chrysanthemicola]